MSFRQAVQSHNRTNVREQQIYNLLLTHNYYLAYSMAKCLEERPSVSLYINLALCLRRIGEMDEAMTCLNKARQLNHAAPDLSNSQWSLREIQFLRAEDEDHAFLNPVDPEIRYPAAFLDLRIELALLDVYRAKDMLEPIRTLIHKYRRLELRSIAEAIQYIERQEQGRG